MYKFLILLTIFDPNEKSAMYFSDEHSVTPVVTPKLALCLLLGIVPVLVLNLL